MRMWEIREGYSPKESYRYGERGGSKSKEEEAYCEGYEDGYSDAMERVAEEKYGNRMGYRGESTRTSGGSSSSNYSNRMGYRDEEDEEMGERRRRRSNGRYY